MDRHDYSCTVLNSVTVRPILPTEREQWDHLMQQCHYLGLNTLPGESIRYVADYNSTWVALLAWTSAALKCRPRDQFIGWSKITQWQNLSLIANNSRFLILPNFHIHNLASKILSLNLKRLSNDWELRFNHPILLAETFVDISRFTGACYKAANWSYLGTTKGFGKSARTYFHHGQPKAIFIRPLSPKAIRRLQIPKSEPSNLRKVNSMTLTQKQADELMTTLLSLDDPRHKRGIRHCLISVIAISVCAVLGGARSFNAIADWAKHRTQNQLQRLRCRFDDLKGCYIPPSEPTIRRVLTDIDAESVDQGICNWLKTVSSWDAISIDGKTVKGAIKPDGTKVHLLAAITHNNNVVIAQKQIPAKTNEIPEARELIRSLDVAGKVITADAMHTQKETAILIVEEKHADYCFTVKGNQPTLAEDIAALDIKAAFPP